MESPDEKTLGALLETDWEETTPRLVLYAQRRIERLIWLGECGGSPPKAMQAEDIVQQAVHDVCIGKRKWNNNKPFIHFLMKDVISSIISNLVESSENKQTTRIAYTTEDPYKVSKSK